ncbi:MAG TPA: hypothetical protein PKA10_07775 [Selenomonadales bacterium]|nr:hypothetical protein [Selenomonadales bacterium]
MEKTEFIKKAKELGFSDEMINRIIQRHDKAAKDGITLPYESELIELPIND